MRKEKKLEIYSARSMFNGIIFYSNKNPDFCAVIKIEDDGNISKEWQKDDVDTSFDETYNKIYINIISFLIIFSVAISIIFTTITPLYGLRAILITSNMLLITAFSLSMFYLWIDPDKSFLRFHSAEHMCINALYKYQRIPTLEEVSKISRFDNSCGTNIILKTILTLTIMFVLSFSGNLLFSVVCIFVFEIIINILTKLGLLNFLQRITTYPPTERELNLAIEGLKFWLENEYKKQPDDTAILDS